ncbi:hypothetical protein PISMIDRAFT_670296, partial [Pisolithus microcarpus 441]
MVAKSRQHKDPSGPYVYSYSLHHTRHGINILSHRIWYQRYNFSHCKCRHDHCWGYHNGHRDDFRCHCGYTLLPMLRFAPITVALPSTERHLL